MAERQLPAVDGPAVLQLPDAGVERSPIGRSGVRLVVEAEGIDVGVGIKENEVG